MIQCVVSAEKQQLTWILRSTQHHLNLISSAVLGTCSTKWVELPKITCAISPNGLRSCCWFEIHTPECLGCWCWLVKSLLQQPASLGPFAASKVPNLMLILIADQYQNRIVSKGSNMGLSSPESMGCYGRQTAVASQSYSYISGSLL